MLKKRINSFRYAGKGVLFFIKTQPNARIHLVAAVIVVSLGRVFEISLHEWIGIVWAIGLVLVTEATNTALEELVNFVSPDYHKKAGIVKDVAAGAVLLAAATALTIGLIIFVPKILEVI